MLERAASAGHMMSRMIVMGVLAVALLAGCASDAATETSAEDGAASDTAAGTEAATCEELADELIAELQEISDSLADASAEELAQDDQVLTDTTERLQEFDQRASDADCGDQIADILNERADSLQGDAPSAEFLRNLLNDTVNFSS
jgi:TolA-binding protein